MFSLIIKESPLSFQFVYPLMLLFIFAFTHILQNQCIDLHISIGLLFLGIWYQFICLVVHQYKRIFKRRH